MVKKSVKAAREAVGDDIELMLDCNNGWIDTVQARQYLSRFEQYYPYFIEEPFSPDDIESHARLAKLTRIPVATAELGYGRWYHKQLLDMGGRPFCRRMRRSVAASPSSSASPRSLHATASRYVRIGSMTSTHCWWPPHPMSDTRASPVSRPIS